MHRLGMDVRCEDGLEGVSARGPPNSHTVPTQTTSRHCQPPRHTTTTLTGLSHTQPLVCILRGQRHRHGRSGQHGVFNPNAFHSLSFRSPALPHLPSTPFHIRRFAPLYFYRFREWMERHPECCARCCKYNQRSAVDRLIQREQVRRWKAAEGGVSNEHSASGCDSDDEVTGLSKVDGKRDRSKSKLRRRTSGNARSVRTVDFGESDIFGPGLLRAHTGKRSLFMVAARDKLGKPARAHHLRSIFHVSFRMAPASVSGPSLSPFRGPLPGRAGSMQVQASMAAPGLPPSACGGRAENITDLTDLEMTPVRRSGLRLRSNVSALANVSSKRVASINDEILGRPAAERGHHRGHRRSVVGGVPDMDALADQAAAEEFLGWTPEDERRSHIKFQVSLVEDVDDGLICVSYVPPRAGSMYIAITGGASHRASIKAHLQGSPFRVDVVAPPTYEVDDDITDNDGGRRESKNNVGGTDDDGEGGKGASRDQDVVKVGWIDLLRGRKTVRRWYKAHGVTENFRIDYYEVDMTANNPMQLRGTLELSLGFTVTDFDPPKRCKEKGLDFGFAVSRGALGGDHMKKKEARRVGRRRTDSDAHKVAHTGAMWASGACPGLWAPMPWCCRLSRWWRRDHTFEASCSPCVVVATPKHLALRAHCLACSSPSWPF